MQQNVLRHEDGLKLYRSMLRAAKMEPRTDPVAIAYHENALKSVARHMKLTPEEILQVTLEVDAEMAGSQTAR